MPTTRAASAPSRRAIRKDEIKGKSQLQISCNSKTQSIAFKLHSQGILTCVCRFTPVQYLGMFGFRFMRRGAPISIAALAALSVLAHLSLRAQSLSTAPGASPTAVTTPGASDARKAYAEGLRAEAEGNWETAFQAYGQAERLSPNDRTIQARAELPVQRWCSGAPKRPRSKF